MDNRTPTLSGLQNVISSITPIIFKKDRIWLEKGYEKCKNLIDKATEDGYSKIAAEVFAMYRYIQGFDDVHFFLLFNDRYLHEKSYRFKYPKFLTNYDCDKNILYVEYSMIPDSVPVGSVITKINDTSVLDYLKQSMLFSPWYHCVLTDRTLFAKRMFIDNGNPYVMRPEVILINDKKKINLKYYPLPEVCVSMWREEKSIEYPFMKYFKKGNILYIRISSFQNLNFEPVRSLLPVSTIVVDLRNNPGGDTVSKISFFYNLFGIHISPNAVFKESDFETYASKKKRTLLVEKFSKKGKMPKNIPNLIIYHKDSFSAAQQFIKMALLYIPKKKLKLIGNFQGINYERFFGYTTVINTGLYKLHLPVCCYFFDDQNNNLVSYSIAN